MSIGPLPALIRAIAPIPTAMHGQHCAPEREDCDYKNEKFFICLQVTEYIPRVYFYIGNIREQKNNEARKEPRNFEMP